MVNAPSVSLKVVVVVHFVLSVWGSMALPVGYAYMNAFILAFGFWAIAAPESVESVFMFMILDLIGILLDIIMLAVFGPHMTNPPKDSPINGSLGKFALAMASINVVVRPLASFVLYRLYQDRGGQYSDFGIPGMPHFGGSGRQGHGYENIDQPIPSNTVETASPHHSIDGKSPIP